MKRIAASIGNRLPFKREGFHDGRGLKRFVTPEEGNSLLFDAISAGGPLMVTRHGSTELSYVYAPNGKMFVQLCEWSGFFPNDPSLGPRFVEAYREACGSIDLLAPWNYRKGRYVEESSLFRAYSPGARLINFFSLEPFLFENPWSKALEGKRVLVVHPFAATIERQYLKRAALFDNKDVLPEFASLQTVQAVQSLGGSHDAFSSWFEAFDWMADEILSREFDIALIACGAYGLPLSARVKACGKIGVHVGGSLQLLFGIKGRRWERGEDSYAKRFYNGNWVRPDDVERPKAADSVEGACYW